MSFPNTDCKGLTESFIQSSIRLFLFAFVLAGGFQLAHLLAKIFSHDPSTVIHSVWTRFIGIISRFSAPRALDAISNHEYLQGQVLWLKLFG